MAGSQCCRVNETWQTVSRASRYFRPRKVAIKLPNAISITERLDVMTYETDSIDFDFSPPVARIPAYLEKTYWWAYVHPHAVKVFEREWLVNAILWGNLARLRDAAIDALGQRIEGKTLQVACVYGDFSLRLADRIKGHGSLDVVDVLPIQLDNLRKKLPPDANVNTHLRDSSNLHFADGSYNQTILFFLLHEQPEAVRRGTLSEALRVTRPGGKIVVVDYHLPKYFTHFAICSGRCCIGWSHLPWTYGITKSPPGCQPTSVPNRFKRQFRSAAFTRNWSLPFDRQR